MYLVGKQRCSMQETPINRAESRLNKLDADDVPRDVFDECHTLPSPEVNPKGVVEDHFNELKQDIDTEGINPDDLDVMAHCAQVVLKATRLDDEYDPSDLYADA